MEAFSKEELYNMLIKCADEKDMRTWNVFKKKNRKMPMDLSDCDFSNRIFEKFDLSNLNFSGSNLSETQFNNCKLNKINLEHAQCFNVIFDKCILVSSDFKDANLAKARFYDCDLRFSNFTNCKIHQVEMHNSNVDNANLFNASLNDSDFKGSTFQFSDLRECEMLNSELEDCRFEASFVDGKTIIWNCYYNKNTNFTGVGLAACRIEPILLSSFQCNIRRIWWQNWYDGKSSENKLLWEAFKKSPIKKIIYVFKYLLNEITTRVVKGFWWITDYGSSTVRLLTVFLMVMLFFAVVYGAFPQLTNDNMLNNPVNIGVLITRAIYFSVVVMTGLGFGEISASESIIWGHLIISLQSLIGYTLLGAFLVRIGILFQGEFPVETSRKNYKSTRH